MHTRLCALLLAGAAAVVFFASCLNPQPDDFPQAGATPNERASQAPSDVEPAPGAAATAPAPLAPSVPDSDEAPPASASSDPAALAPTPPTADADAGVPADGGPPDAAPVVAQ